MRAVFHSINGRILIFPFLLVIALVLVGVASIRTIAEVTLVEHQARARAVTEAATKIVEAFEAKAAAGAMTREEAEGAAKEVLRAIRFDGNEYVIVRGVDGMIIVNGLFKDREGVPSWDSKDASGGYFARDMIAAAQAGGGFNYYMWPKAPNTPPLRKVTYSKLSSSWKWVVGSGVYLDDVEAATWDSASRTGLMVAIIALIGFAAAFLIGRRITGPILELTRATHRLADNDLSVSVPGTARRDEIGTMAKAISVLKDRSAEANRLTAEQERLKAEAARQRQAEMQRLASELEASVKSVVETISLSAGEMEASANSMHGVAGTASRETSAAAAASDETSARVGMMAAATEELAASIQEIARQIAQCSHIVSEAVSEMGGANQAISALSDSTRRVGDIVALISGIAGQTNLLALNATIEAARAGEVGKGFAVVASEVKSLANATAKATDEIQATVAEIDAMTGNAVSAIEGVGRTVTRIDGITAALAAAVEEQGAATREIAGNVQQAAAGTQAVAGNVAAADRAVAETGTVAENVRGAAATLAHEAARLRSEVDQFLSGVRAA